MEFVVSKRKRLLNPALVRTAAKGPRVMKGQFVGRIKELNRGLADIRLRRSAIEEDLAAMEPYLHLSGTRKQLKRSIVLFLVASGMIQHKAIVLRRISKGGRVGTIAFEKDKKREKHDAWLEKEILSCEQKGILPKGFWHSCLVAYDKQRGIP